MQPQNRFPRPRRIPCRVTVRFPNGLRVHYAVAAKSAGCALIEAVERFGIETHVQVCAR